MIKKILLSIFCLTFFSCISTQQVCNLKHIEKSHYTTFEKVEAALKDNKKEVFLLFGADWCPSCKKLKELLGGRKIIEGLGFHYNTASVRLLCYLPGNVLPWHFDNMGNWFKQNKNVNPNINTMTCDLGNIKRYFIAFYG